ncbi:hypothetical protein [Streptomyces scopuliridis]|uniref:hypothetical protein n=1 Tax=Streptomyces scopuliridis TaxID=452529 RepID=UPI003412BF55
MPDVPASTTYRLCNAAGCDYQTEVNETDPDAAWDATTDHCKTAHGMTGSDAAYFVSWHSKTVIKES